MSRAFVKEGDGSLEPLPDLPISTQPNWVTPRGLADLQARLRIRQEDLAKLRARSDRLDRLPEAAAERDIRYLEARLRSAVVIDPAAQNLDEMAFGLMVLVSDPDGKETTYQITGEDEADASKGWIAPHSPLARALTGARSGDLVTWKRPVGDVELEVLKITRP